MAEQLQFDLALVERITGPAKRAADSLRKIEADANKAGKALNFSDEIKKATQELAKLKLDPKGYQTLLKAQRELRKEQEKLQKAAGVTEGSGLGWGVAAASAVGVLVAGAYKVGGLLKEGIKGAFEEGGKAENLRLSYKLLLGNKAGNSLDDVGRFAKLTRFDDDTIAGLIRPLFRAGFDQKSARTAFAAAADLAAANGGKEESVAEYIDAFQRIKLKGGVDSRRLVALGVNEKDFFGSLSKQLGISEDEAKKRAEEGKIDPQKLLNTIYAGIEKRQGGQLGTGAIAASKTLEARLSKILDLPNQYLKAVSTSPQWEKLSDKLGETLSRLDPDSANGQRVVTGLLRAFDRLADAVSSALTPQNIDKFADGAEKVVGYVERLPEIFDKVLTKVELIATIWAASKILDGIDKLIKFAPQAGTDIGKSAAFASSVASGAAGFGAAALPVAAPAAGALGALAVHNYLLDNLDLQGASDRLKADLLTGRKRGVQGFFGTSYEDVTDPAEQQRASQDYVRNLQRQGVNSLTIGGRTISLAPQINVTVQATPGEDPTHTSQKIAEESHKSLVKLFERAGQEAGAF